MRAKGTTLEGIPEIRKRHPLASWALSRSVSRRGRAVSEAGGEEGDEYEDRGEVDEPEDEAEDVLLTEA
ncbi:hypothetical protein FRC09_010327, partial [Ceratobasidium sp. 395]